MTSSAVPAFTVIVATFARGPLIEATLLSIENQELQDFEVLVVSDGPAAPGLAETVARFDDRFRLLETPVRHRSQSGPNNLGWEVARGEYVAYLGHDDIWHPGHLRLLAGTFGAAPEASFAVSGCIYFGPPGTADDLLWVTGVFDSADASVPHEHFFPPSSFAHVRLLPPQIGRWPDAVNARRPVDAAFLRRAAEGGCGFASTQVVTVFKFASALRYLSYLSPDDGEQRRMLDLIAREDALGDFIETKVRIAEQRGNVMASRYQRDDPAPGVVLERNERTRGIAATPVVSIPGSVWIPAGDDWRGFDWHDPEPHPLGRWSGPNERPRLLIPYTDKQAVRVRVHVSRFASEDVRRSLVVTVNRDPVAAEVDEGPAGFVISFRTPLRAESPSVIELQMARAVPAADAHASPGDRRLVGLFLVGVELETERAWAARDDRDGPSRAYLMYLLERERSAVEHAMVERDLVRRELEALLASRTWRATAWYRRLRQRLARPRT